MRQTRRDHGRCHRSFYRRRCCCRCFAEGALRIRAGVRVAMGSTAAVTALRKFGAKKIAVLTPHQPKGDETVRAYLAEAGFDIVRLHGLKCASPFAIAEGAAAAVAKKPYTRSTATTSTPILQVGTNLANAVVAADAERWLSKPVLAGNECDHLLGRIAQLRDRRSRLWLWPYSRGVLGGNGKSAYRCRRCRAFGPDCGLISGQCWCTSHRPRKSHGNLAKIRAPQRFIRRRWRCLNQAE